MIQALIGPIASLAGSFLENKVEQSKSKGAVAKAEAEAKAKVLVSSAESVAEWEKIMAQSTQNSWRDEAVTIVVLVPVCLVFVPGMEEVVKAGFDRLNELPAIAIPEEEIELPRVSLPKTRTPGRRSLVKP